MQLEPKPKKPHMMGLAVVTYTLVAGTILLSVATYYYYLAQVPAGDQIEADATRRMLIGAVWVPIYEHANYVEPQSLSENQITTGAVKFRTQDPAGEVLGFFEKTLKRSGYFIQPTGTAGGTLQGVTDKGKMSVTITVTSSSENTTGEIHTLRHIEPKDAKGTSPQKPWLP